MAIYQTRNCIRATQWDPEDKQSLENIKALVKENPRLGWRVDDNILSNKVTTGIERGINNMCNYSDFIEQKALEKGTVNTFAVSVANLVKAGVLTTEKALDTLQVPDNIRAAVAEQAASLINNN